MTKLDFLIMAEKNASVSGADFHAHNTMEKNAAVPTWLRNAGAVLGAGTGIYFGAQMGSGLGRDAASLVHRGPVGLGSETKWKHDHEKRLKSLVDYRQLRKAKKEQTDLGHVGLGAGGLAVLPFSRKPLLIAGGVLAGRSLGRFLAKKKNPILSSLDMDPTDSSMGATSGILSSRQRKAWHSMLTNPAIASDPEFKKRLVDYYNEVAQARPEYEAYAAKKRKGSILGGIVGASAMAAAMFLGKKRPASAKRILEYAKKKKITESQAASVLKHTKLQKLLGGKTYWPWAGLSAGALGLGVAKTMEGGRRAGISKKEINSRTREKVMSELGMDLLFYGGGPV